MVRIVTKKSPLYSRQEIWFWDQSDGTDFPQCSNNIYYQALTKPPFEAELTPFHTSIVDLSLDGEAIMSGFSKTTKTHCRRAEREGAVFAVLDLKDAAIRQQYRETYDAWAASKNMAQIDTDRFTGMADSGNLTLFEVSFDGEPVVWHTYVHDDQQARMLTSHHNLNFADQNVQGRCNKYMHWQTILYFKGQGLTRYDFGGVDEEATPGIARFKLSFGGERVTHYNFAVTKGLYKLKQRLG